MHGKLFPMHKFRSMMVNAPDIRIEDGSTYNGDDAPRVTKLGRFLRKTSIGEIPQFLTLLTDQMSLIEPRPDLPDDLERYTDEEKGEAYTAMEMVLHLLGVGPSDEVIVPTYAIVGGVFQLRLSGSALMRML